jgi:hypothetical protein
MYHIAPFPSYRNANAPSHCPSFATKKELFGRLAAKREEEKRARRRNGVLRRMIFLRFDSGRIWGFAAAERTPLASPRERRETRLRIIIP